jgi:hypothetical protein
VDRRHRLGLALLTLVAVSACSPTSELRDAVEADREYDGTRADGIDDGWYRPITASELTVGPTLPDVALVLVTGSVFDEQIIESIEPVGACDPACLGVASTFAEAQAENRELDLLHRSFCDNCEEGFMALVAVENGAARSVDRDEAIEMLQPIDTEDEVRIVFDDYDLIRSVEDGWEVIRTDTPSCTDEDTPHGRWSVTSTGDVSELESFVAPGSTEGGVACV